MTKHMRNENGTFEIMGMIIAIITMWLAYFVLSAVSNSILVQMNQMSSYPNSSSMQELTTTMPNIIGLIQMITILATIVTFALIAIRLIGFTSDRDISMPSGITPTPRAPAPTSLPTVPVRRSTITILAPTPAPEPAPARNTDNRWETLDVAMETDKDTF